MEPEDVDPIGEATVFRRAQNLAQRLALVGARRDDQARSIEQALEGCIASAVKTWTFPPAVGGTATISHVFVLR